MPAGDKARGTPKTTPNIEYLLFGGEFELTEKIFRCLTATDMEFINGSEIVDGYGVDRFAKRLDPAADRSCQVAMRVMIGDILLSRHCPPPEQDRM